MKNRTGLKRKCRTLLPKSLRLGTNVDSDASFVNPNFFIFILKYFDEPSYYKLKMFIKIFQITQ